MEREKPYSLAVAEEARLIKSKIDRCRESCDTARRGELTVLQAIAPINPREEIRTYLSTLCLCLQGFSDTLPAILDTLDYQGTPFDARGCPLARLLADASGEKIVITHDGISVMWEGESEASETITTPSGLMEFVRKFDDGYFPYLETTDAIDSARVQLAEGIADDARKY